MQRQVLPLIVIPCICTGTYIVNAFVNSKSHPDRGVRTHTSTPEGLAEDLEVFSAPLYLGDDVLHVLLGGGRGCVNDHAEEVALSLVVQLLVADHEAADDAGRKIARHAFQTMFRKKA